MTAHVPLTVVSVLVFQFPNHKHGKREEAFARLDLVSVSRASCTGQLVKFT